MAQQLNTNRNFGVLWGQHRTTERIAVAVKDILIADEDIQTARVPFVEYGPWRREDYIEVLHRLAEVDGQPDAPGDVSDFIICNQEDLRRYEAGLREAHGTLLNLHDGYKFPGVGYDIEFWLQKWVDDRDTLGSRLEELADYHGLKLRLVMLNVDGEQGGLPVAPQSITVEFMTPEPHRMRHPSPDIPDLIAKYDPHETTAHRYKQADMSDLLYTETACRYAAFMKAVLLDGK